MAAFSSAVNISAAGSWSWKQRGYLNSDLDRHTCKYWSIKQRLSADRSSQIPTHTNVYKLSVTISILRGAIDWVTEILLATYWRALSIVVPHKRIEGSQLHPSDTQFTSGGTTKSTDISTHKWYTKELKVQNPWNTPNMVINWMTRCWIWTRWGFYQGSSSADHPKMHYYLLSNGQHTSHYLGKLTLIAPQFSFWDEFHVMPW